jgi:tetratricopeptide (TPR) repeat protein
MTAKRSAEKNRKPGRPQAHHGSRTMGNAGNPAGTKRKDARGAARGASGPLGAIAGRALSAGVLRVLLILAAIAAVYMLSLGNDFVYDDRYVILNNEVVTDPAKTAEAFDVQFYSGLNYYRPIPLVLFAFEHRLWGAQPLGYHLTNLMLLMGAALALYFLLARLLGNGKQWLACLLALAFGLHPAVSSVGMALGARGDLLCLLFLLCAYIGYAHRSKISYAAATLLFALALLSKETAVTFPLVLLLMELLCLTARGRGPGTSGARVQGRESGARALALRLAPFWAILAAYIVLRLAVLPGLASEPALDPVLTIKSYLYMFQASLLPTVGLAYEPFFGDWFSWPRLGLSVALASVIVALFVMTDRSRYRTIAFWLGWAGVTFLPTANIVGQETIFDERYTVLPLIGLVTGVGLLVFYAGKQPRAYMRGKLTFCILILLCFGAITTGRGKTWSDDLTFFAQWIRTSPDNPRPKHHLGIVFWDKGRRDVAAGLFSDAVRLDPGYVPSLNMLGLSAYMNGNNDTAVEFCSRAVDLDPNYSAAQYNLASAYHAKGQPENALAHYAAAATLDPAWLEALFGVAKCSQELHKWEDAVINYRRVLQLDSGVPGAYFGLSEIYEELERPSQAAGLLRQGLAYAPGDTAAARRLGRLLGNNPGKAPNTATERP